LTDHAATQLRTEHSVELDMYHSWSSLIIYSTVKLYKLSLTNEHSQIPELITSWLRRCLALICLHAM
jgi:hypothetical protein